MILIDKEKFIEEVRKRKYSAASIRLINEQPEVKAIPVEWIEEWQNRHEWEYDSYFTMRDGKPKYAIECMIEDWEKENEQNKCRYEEKENETD